MTQSRITSITADSVRLELGYAPAVFIADCCAKAGSTGDLVEQATLTMLAHSIRINADLVGLNGCFEQVLGKDEVEAMVRALRSVAGGEINHAAELASLMGAIASFFFGLFTLNRGFSLIEDSLVFQIQASNPTTE